MGTTVTVDNPQATITIVEEDVTIYTGVVGPQGGQGPAGPVSTVPGPTGNGISSIVRTSGTGAAGTTDTYTITYTSGATTTFGVYNGANGNIGPDGRGITSISKSSTSGLTDTYTIVYTSGSNSTFQVVNGATGAAGKGISTISKTGTSGLVDTYTITYTDATTTTYTVTNGASGTDGTNGSNGQGYTARGNWSSSTTYAAYDVVYYNGSTYYALQSGTNQTPSTSSAYWSLHALGVKTPLAYNTMDTFSPGDFVTRLGSTYYNIREATNIAPPNATYWTLFASKGDTGPTGPTGPTGQYPYPIAANTYDVTPRFMATSASGRSLSSGNVYWVAYVPTVDITVSTITVATTAVTVPLSSHKFQAGIFTGNTSTPSTMTCLSYGRFTSDSVTPNAFTTINTAQVFTLGSTTARVSGTNTTTSNGAPTSLTLSAGVTYWIGISAYASGGFTTGAAVQGYPTSLSILDPWLVTGTNAFSNGDFNHSSGSNTISTQSTFVVTAYPFFQLKT